jgi:hypothetical protein
MPYVVQPRFLIGIEMNRELHKALGKQTQQKNPVMRTVVIRDWPRVHAKPEVDILGALVQALRPKQGFTERQEPLVVSRFACTTLYIHKRQVKE